LEALYRSHGIRHFAVECAPAATFGDASTLLRTSSYMRLSTSAVMYREVVGSGVPAGALVVRRARPEEAPEFAGLCRTVFGLAEPYTELFAESVRRDESRHWLAFDGAKPVAAAITIASASDCDWIGWVGTLAQFRRRGAQSALTAAQLNDCVQRGSKLVTLEVNTGVSADSMASYRNYVRLGWRVAHERTTYMRRLKR
jgi:predicted GNAT family acetyltransferase